MTRFARRHGLDLLIVAAAVAGVVEVLVRPRASAPAGLVAVAVLALVLPLLARERSPFLAPAWLWLLAAALSFVDGQIVPSSTGVYAGGLIAAFLIGSLRDERQGRIGLGIVVGSAAIIVLNDPTHEATEVLLIPGVFSLAWLGGYAHRGRAVEASEAEERARRAEREREVTARIAVAEERARIARELHDIVAHAVSVMVLQTGAVRHRMGGADPEDAEALRGVEETGRAALSEMRRLLGAMRHGEDGPELEPAPGLDRLDVLLRETRRAGLPVELHVDGEPVALPVGIDLSAYRIVQEGLTNALKHAQAGRADVHLRYGAGQLRIEVADDGRGTTASDGRGHGLVGVRERVTLYGGEMSTASANGGGFRLTTTLPLDGGEP